MGATTTKPDLSDEGGEPSAGGTTARHGLDRFSLAIALGVVALVGVLLAVIIARPENSVPMDESRPAGVVHNYFLALINDDPKTAYGYLSADAQSKQSYEVFAARHRGAGRNERVRVEDERLEGETARVTVRTSETWSSPSLFSPGTHTYERTVVLRLEGGSWKLTQSP